LELKKCLKDPYSTDYQYDRTYDYQNKFYRIKYHNQSQNDESDVKDGHGRQMCHGMVGGSRFDAEKPAVDGDEEVLDNAKLGDEGTDVEIEAKTAVKVSVS
jgi:hypothetical protein